MAAFAKLCIHLVHLRVFVHSCWPHAKYTWRFGCNALFIPQRLSAWTIPNPICWPIFGFSSNRWIMDSVNIDGKRPIRFSVHRTLISWKAIYNICVQCTKSEHLSRVVGPDFFVRILVFNLYWKDIYSRYLVRRINWILVYLSQRH